MRTQAEIKAMIEVLAKLDTSRMYLNDFFHTWKESDDEIAAVFQVAEILRAMREDNISTKVISIYRDYTYTSLGTGTFTSQMWTNDFPNETFPVEIQKADQVNWYKLIGVIEEGYDIIIQVAEDGVTATIPEQTCCSDLNGSGAGIISAEGELENGVFTFTTTYMDDVYMYGPAIEIITLP